MVFVQWGDQGKYIFFSNLLYYNPDIFGYHIKECKPLYYCTYKNHPIWIKNWYSKFKYEYYIANIWRYITPKNIPMVCLDKILDYWGDL